MANGTGRLQIGLMMRNGENLPLGAGRVVRWAELRDMARLAEPWQKLEEACRDVGRSPDTLMRTAACLVTLPGAEAEPAGLPPNTIGGSPAAVAAQLHALHQAGVEHMNVFLGPWTLRGIEQFGRVLEELRKLDG